MDFKKLGPYPILSQVNPVAYKLKLPPTLKIHNVFHVSLLEPYIQNTIPTRKLSPPPPVIIQDELEYEVATILDSCKKHRRLYYLVDWVGYDKEEQSWEPATSLVHCKDLVKKFHQKYPYKPKP